MPYVPSTSCSAGRHRLLERALVELLDQVREHLGVGLGHEAVPLRDQHLPQRRVVLDDAVVHDRDVAGAVGVRVRVAARSGAPCVAQRVCAMPVVACCPSRLSCASSAAILPAAFWIDQPAVGDQRDAGRVVAAVLQPLEPVQQDGERLPRPDVPHDPAHTATSPLRSARPCPAPPAPRASASVGASAMIRTTGSVPDGPHVHPPVGQRQPQSVLPVRRRARERPAAARHTRRRAIRRAGGPWL